MSRVHQNPTSPTGSSNAGVSPNREQRAVEATLSFFQSLPTGELLSSQIESSMEFRAQVEKQFATLLDMLCTTPSNEVEPLVVGQLLSCGGWLPGVEGLLLAASPLSFIAVQTVAFCLTVPSVKLHRAVVASGLGTATNESGMSCSSLLSTLAECCRCKDDLLFPQTALCFKLLCLGPCCHTMADYLLAMCDESLLWRIIRQSFQVPLTRTSAVAMIQALTDTVRGIQFLQQQNTNSSSETPGIGVIDHYVAGTPASKHWATVRKLNVLKRERR